MSRLELPRLQLMEFNDWPHAPEFVRDAIVEALGRTLERGRMLEALVPLAVDFVDRAGVDAVLDLCAGSGAPAGILYDACARGGVRLPPMYLTDLYPHVDAWRDLELRSAGRLLAVPESVDATAIPEALARGKARMIINSFHHFPPPLAASIVADAVRTRAPLLIAECFGRNPLGFAPFAPAGLPAVALNPFYARRHRLSRALFTWCVPLIPALGTFDGLVSTLRCYTERELRQMMTAAGAGPDWDVRFDTFGFPWGGRGTCFSAVPPGR